MAGGLTLLWRGAAPRRRVAGLVLVALVVVVHGLATDRLAERMAELEKDVAMPARIEVAYVREMEPSTPPPVAAPAAAAPARPVPHKAARPVAKPASAPASAARVAEEPASSPPLERASAEAPPDLPPPAPTPEVAAQPAAEAASTVASAATDEGATSTAVAGGSSSNMLSVAPDAEPFEWPASTRMSYLLTGNVSGPVEGSAQVEWIRVDSHYQVHVDVLVGPSFAPVASRRMSSDGEISAQGLVPRRYDQQTRAFGTDRGRVTMSFDPDGVVLGNGERRATIPGVQDSASQFVQLTYLFSTRPELLRVGGSVDFPLALPHKVDTWTYDVVGEEDLYTRFGPLATIHLKPRRIPAPNALAIEMWFAPQLRYLPVRFVIRQNESTYVDLLISKKPEMGSR